MSDDIALLARLREEAASDIDPMMHMSGQMLCEEAADRIEALTKAEADARRYRSAIRWALGYDEGEPQFEPPKDSEPKYAWRKELQRRAGLT